MNKELIDLIGVVHHAFPTDSYWFRELKNILKFNFIFQHSAPVSNYSSLSFGQPFPTLCGLSPFQHFPSQPSIPHIPSIFTAGHYSGNVEISNV